MVRRAHGKKHAQFSIQRIFETFISYFIYFTRQVGYNSEEQGGVLRFK